MVTLLKRTSAPPEPPFAGLCSIAFSSSFFPWAAENQTTELSNLFRKSIVSERSRRKQEMMQPSGERNADARKNGRPDASAREARDLMATADIS